MANLIKKFELKPNLIIDEPELEPESCDIGTTLTVTYQSHHSTPCHLTLQSFIGHFGCLYFFQ